MKILKVLKEQEENNNLQTIDGGGLGPLAQKFEEVEKKGKDLGWKFSTDMFKSPDDKYKCTITLYLEKHKELELNLGVKVYLTLTETKIPLDFLIVCTKWVMNRVKEMLPELVELTADPSYTPGMITYNFREVFISYKDTFLSLYDYMNRAYYNTNVVNIIPIEELLNDNSIEFNYKLEESQVPKYSDDYSLATDKMLKKVYSVYKGFRKGTFKGHQYEYVRQVPQISILTRKEFLNTSSGIIEPDFKVKVNAGYVTIDGKGTSDLEHENNRFPDYQLVKEFNEYIKARFNQFGIDIM